MVSCFFCSASLLPAKILEVIGNEAFIFSYIPPGVDATCPISRASSALLGPLDSVVPPYIFLAISSLVKAGRFTSCEKTLPINGSAGVKEGPSLKPVLGSTIDIRPVPCAETVPPLLNIGLFKILLNMFIQINYQVRKHLQLK